MGPNNSMITCTHIEARRQNILARRAENELDTQAQAAADARAAKRFRAIEQRRNGEPTNASA